MNGLGTITVEGETRTLRFERLLRFAREEVWAALTEPARLADWLAKATVDPGPDGSVTLDFGEGGKKIGRITAWEPPSVLAYEWNYIGEEPSHVRFELEVTGDGSATRLTLEHTRLAADISTSYGAGWHAHLDQLEGHLAGDVPDWSELFAELQPQYAEIAASTTA
jgi:uncharacterized protein YndB with AHSA1/START domain